MAGYGFWLYAFGPALALLQAELRFSYTMLGVYSALWSVGSAFVGVSFAVLARRLHRAALLWCSASPARPCSPASRRSCPTGTVNAATAR
jgi:hypothetical protein